MKFKTEQFADLFYSNLPAHQKKANNEWLKQMTMFKMVVSPDNSYPPLTNLGDGWWECDDTGYTVANTSMERFLLFGELAANGRILWDDHNLNKKQRRFIHDMSKALRKAHKQAPPGSFNTGDLCVVMYNNDEDFLGNTLGGCEDKQAARDELTAVFNNE